VRASNGLCPAEPEFAVANWMCVAIDAMPTSGRRALTQLISAARLNGSGSLPAASATSSQMVGSPPVLTNALLDDVRRDPPVNPVTRRRGPSPALMHAIGYPSTG
jgi:hypothetical protein